MLRRIGHRFDLTQPNPHYDHRSRFEEGQGAQLGCPKRYWEQRFTAERHYEVESAGDGKVIMSSTRVAGGETEAKPTELIVWRTPDNTTFHCLNPTVQQFFELGGYRAFPDVCTVDIVVKELTEVNSSAGSFRVGFVMSIRWYDRAFDGQAHADQAGSTVFARTIP